MPELREKLETVFVERALPQPKLERMSVGELLYHAVVECGESCRRMSGAALQKA